MAATAPVIRTQDEEISHAIGTIFLFNLVAVFLFPALERAMGMSDLNFEVFAGTAINDTLAVVAAATAWSNKLGSNTALQLATIVKLTRTLMIVPIALLLAFYTEKREASASKNGEHPADLPVVCASFFDGGNRAKNGPEIVFAPWLSAHFA